MADFYERTGQKIYITYESSYGTPHTDGSSNGGTQWTKLEATYEDLNEINIIPSGTEVPLPKINKLKKYDISASKHPSQIVSGNREPIEFTMDLELQAPIFLAYAVGQSDSSNADKHIVTEAKKDNVNCGSNELCSFTMHCEQDNNTDAQDIAYDLFGCIVSEYELSINKGDETVTESVTIKAPMCSLDGNINTSGSVGSLDDEIYTWNMLEGTIDSNDQVYSDETLSTDKYILEENASDISPTSIEDLTLTISNNVEFLPDVGKRHMVFGVSTQRDITFSMSGYISNRTILDYWEEKFDSTNNRPDSASTPISGCLYLEKSASEYIYLPMNSLLPVEHSCEFASIEDGLKGADLSFEDSVPQDSTNRRIIYDTDNSVNVLLYDSLASDFYQGNDT